MWDLWEPASLFMRTFKSGPLCGTLKPGARFRAAAPNHPETLLEEPLAFQAVGEKHQKCHVPCKNMQKTLLFVLNNLKLGVSHTSRQFFKVFGGYSSWNPCA